MTPVRHNKQTGLPRPGQRPLVVVLLALLSLALFATACGSSDGGAADDPVGQVTTEPEEPVEEDGDETGGEPINVLTLCDDQIEQFDGEPLPPMYVAAASLCAAAAGDDGALEGLTVVDCQDEGDGFELQINGGRAYWQHMGIRFHPADERLTWAVGKPKWEPQPIPAASVSTPLKVVVVDEAEHGRHAMAVIESMLVDVDPQPEVMLLEVNPTTRVGDLAIFSDSAIEEMLPEQTEEGTVFNMSFGSYGCEPSPLDQSILRIVASGADVVASAGNDESGELVYPAALPGVHSVGSLEDDQTTRSCFSNHGNWVTHWAVGEEVVAGGMTWSGTSFAAPQVAATFAATGTADEFATGDPKVPVDLHTVRLLDATSDNPNAVEVLDVNGEPVTIQTYCAEGSDYQYRNVDYEPWN